jgi:hypothetical protein
VGEVVQRVDRQQRLRLGNRHVQLDGSRRLLLLDGRRLVRLDGRLRRLGRSVDEDGDVALLRRSCHGLGGGRGRREESLVGISR